MLPNGLETIGAYAFNQINLDTMAFCTIHIPASVTIVNQYSFGDAYINTVVFAGSTAPLTDGRVDLYYAFSGTVSKEYYEPRPGFAVIVPNGTYASYALNQVRISSTQHNLFEVDEALNGVEGYAIVTMHYGQNCGVYQGIYKHYINVKRNGWGSYYAINTETYFNIPPVPSSINGQSFNGWSTSPSGTSTNYSNG
jgi:hypothetical protein